MQYFAGLFDAEGYVSLCPKGSFTIAIEMTNEKIPNLFKEKFAGSIYTRQREKRKRSYTWKINSISEQALYFINSVCEFSVVKQSQLIKLRDYLNQSRDGKKQNRSITCSIIKKLKSPLIKSIQTILERIEKPIEPYFFEWLAGFIDGDGNIVCNQYTDNRNGKKYFAHQLSVFNTFPQSIAYIHDRIEGSVLVKKGTSNPIFKWACKTHNEKFVCQSILPFLKIKKRQCELFLEFIQIPKKTRNCGYPVNTLARMYEIINQIKHLNSL